jgi:radical SAM protein with 4Fe4S-binding SPASM domain
MAVSASQSGEKSTAAAAERMFALGLGLTNECNLACSFCYRDPTRVDRLSLEQVRAVVTFIAVMMRSNFDRLAEIADIVKAYDAPLRINVYQSVRSDAFALTYDEYWRGFEALFARTDAIAIGEPLVRAMAGLPPRRGGCGVATVRVTPRATVQPCVYWPGDGAPLDVLLDLGPSITDTDPFSAARGVPSACKSCSHVGTCGGGCAGRRRLAAALDAPDPYCPVVRGGSRKLTVQLATSRDLPKLESACTTIVVAR